MHAKVFKREWKTNKHTVAVLYQRHDFILITFFETLIHFVLFFITVTDLGILTNMLIPGTTLIKNGSSFPPPRLFRATRLFGREEYFKTETDVAQKSDRCFFFLILTVQGDIHRKDFKWKNIWRYGVNFWKCSFLYVELKKRAEASSNSYSVTEDLYNIFIMCLWLRIIRTTDQYVQFLNFPSQIFFWRYLSWLQSSYIEEKFFVAASVLFYDCAYLFLLWKGAQNDAHFNCIIPP